MQIDDYRKQIDDIDSQLVELYLKRMDIAKEIGRLKGVSGSSVNVPSREQEVISRLADMTDDSEMKAYIKQLYSTIFSTSKSYQSSVISMDNQLVKDIHDALSRDRHFPISATVACQGVDGAYSKVAADKLFDIPKVTYFKNFDAVFSAVDKGLCRYGVLPIENSNTGSISQVYDLMRKHSFYIVGSVRVHVKHTLASVKGATIGGIKKVYSHEQGLLQCDKYLKSLGVETVIVENTALAARMVAEAGDTSIAAICSPLASEIYSLSVLADDVQDNRDNYTRFICVSKHMQIFNHADKISIMLNASHTPGSLNKLLSRFSALGLNLTKLESRPVGNSHFEFMFYFDFEADIEDVRVVNLLAELDDGAGNFTFLGSYKEKI